MVLNEVMAFKRMEYCELVEAAVLGVAEAEATVKLSCECMVVTSRRRITISVVCVGGMLLIMICIY